VKSIPGPRGLELLKTIWSFQRDPLQTLVRLTRTYGDLITYRFGPFRVVLLNHPEAVQRALVDNHPNYGKRHSPFYRMLKNMLGGGLLTNDGEDWLRQRRLAQPAFQRRKLEALKPMIVGCTEQMLDRWQRHPQPVLDISREMMQLTLQIVGLALFSQDLSQAGQAVGEALDELQVQMGERFSALLPLPPIFPTPRDRRFRRAKASLRSLSRRLVAERRGQSDPPADLLTSLIQARDPETGATMSDEQICDELATFMLAGHETTANTLTWALYLLSLHPEQRRRLEAELDHPAGVCERILNETLRLYPPAWVYGRRSFGPDEFLGYPIPANQLVTVCPFVLHRHPRYWPNPEGFDPDRFLAEIPRGAFVPFAAGPRQCIGNHFAMLEAQWILTTMARRVRLNLMPGSRVELDPRITLRPEGGLPMTLEFRQS
jgi:cytochrome P450